MKAERVQIIYFFIILIASLGLAAALAYPFLGALTVSLALAIAFRPLYRRLVKKLSGRRGLAAWLTILLIILIVIIPLSLIGIKVWNEIGNLYANLAGSNIGNITDRFPTVSHWLATNAPGVNFDLQSYAERGVEWLFLNLNALFSSALSLIFNLLIILVTLFYLFRDGHKFRQVLIRLSPLADKDDQTIISQLELTIGSVVKGTILIALVHGLAAGLGFTVFGVAEPILWAILVMVASILPGLGSSLVFIPLVIYLAYSGNYGAAIGLTLWGAIIVGSIDNVLRPFLLERDIKIHPLLILLSVLGGLSVFGVLGFILGPIILSFAVSLSQIYLSGNRQPAVKKN
ncbi:MAG: AI-2E family transporter [Candidatus Vogelbacteria bacterium]|nr:AI-2E family transporter [Candidatus Vogelbacteria bacterium]